MGISYRKKKNNFLKKKNYILCVMWAIVVGAKLRKKNRNYTMYGN